MGEFWGIVFKATIAKHSTLSAMLSDVYKDVFAANFDGIARQSNSGVGQHLAGGHVELPAMPRTGNDLPVELTFADGAAAMQTNAIDSKELALDVSHSDGRASKLELANRARQKLVPAERSQKSHSYSRDYCLIFCLDPSLGLNALPDAVHE